MIPALRWVGKRESKGAGMCPRTDGQSATPRTELPASTHELKRDDKRPRLSRGAAAVESQCGEYYAIWTDTSMAGSRSACSSALSTDWGQSRFSQRTQLPSTCLGAMLLSRMAVNSGDYSTSLAVLFSTT